MQRLRRIGVALVAAAVLASGFGALAAADPSAPEGRLVFSTGGDGVSGRLEIATMRPHGSDLRKLTHHDPEVWTSHAMIYGWYDTPFWTTRAAVIFHSRDRLTERTATWSLAPASRRLVRLPASEYDSVSPSGRFIARATGSGALVILTAHGRRVRTIGLRLGSASFADDRPARWSPDERHIAINAYSETPELGYVVVARVDGKAPPRRITPRRQGHSEYAYSWSPDGRRLLVEVTENDRYDRAVAYSLSRTGTGRRRLFAAGIYGGAHAWSPAGRRIAYVGPGGDVRIVSALGGPSTRLAWTRYRGKAVGEAGLDWSRHGLIAYTDRDGIHVVRPSGSGRRLLTRRRSDGSPHWSPDGARLMFAEAGGGIVAVRPNGAVQPLLKATVSDDSSRWSPDGSQIAFIRGPAELADPSRIGIFVMGADGSRQRRVGTGYGPVWSADARRVAYVLPLAAQRRYVRYGAGRITVVDPAGAGAVVVGTGTAPAWAPNGRELAFMRYTFRTEHEGTKEERWIVTSSTLYRVGADGTGLREVLSTSLSREEPMHYTPAWSPDGSTIAFSSVQRTWSDEEAEWSSEGFTSLLDLRNGGVRKLTSRHGSPLAWSPDGRSLAFASGPQLVVATMDGAVRSVYRVPAGDLDLTEIRDPAWSPDGRRLALISCIAPLGEGGRAPNCDIYVVPSAGGRATRLTKTPGFEGGLDWSNR